MTCRATRTSRSARDIRRGYAIVRSMILAVSTLAIVGVLFAVYQYSTGVGEPAKVSTRSPAIAPPIPPPAAPPTAGVPAGDGTLGPGKSIRLIEYEPKTRQARFELEVSDYRPIGDKDSESYSIELTDPVIRLTTSNGQRVRVKAESGRLEVEKRGGAPEPKGGELAGGVVIDVDRLPEKDRQTLPPDQRDAPPDASRLIQFEADSIEFDIEASRVETSDTFSFRMSELELKGNGLKLRYNQVDTRVEDFEIPGGGLMTLFGEMASLGSGFGLEQQPTNLAAGATGAGEGVGVGRQSAKSDDANPALFEPYRAQINQAVTVRRYQGEETIQRLDADKIEVLFDFVQSHREALRSGKSPVIANSSAGADSTAGAGSPDATAASRTVIAWTGPFVVRPQHDNDEMGPAAATPRLQVVATGRKVTMSDAQGGATCSRLEVHRHTQQIWISGTDGERIEVRLPGKGLMAAAAVHLDQAAGRTTITGPAQMEDIASADGDSLPGMESAQDGGKRRIRFSNSAELRMTTPKANPGTHGLSKPPQSNSQYIGFAAFSGEVVMQQGADLIASEQVQLVFDPPQQQGIVSQNIRELNAQGDVLLVRGTNRLTCGNLDVSFVPGPKGRTFPRLATAKRDVVVHQDALMVTAGESVSIAMTPMQRKKPPFSRAEAYREAVRNGLDPATIDWDRAAADNATQVDYDVGIEHLEAVGAVTAFDPNRKLDVSADTFSVDFKDGRELSALRATGPGGNDAFIGFGDFSIAARRIDADMAGQHADIFGAGKATFVTYRGLDGSRSDAPQDVEVSWTREMSYRGASNTARFTGNVHAVSRRRLPSSGGNAFFGTGAADSSGMLETATFDGDEILLDLVDVEAPDTRKRESTDQWWVFGSLVDRWIAPKQASAPQFNKEPVYVVALRDVVCVFTNADAVDGRVVNRVRLDGEKLTADLRARLVTVPTAGTLLIEDYKNPASSAAAPVESGGSTGSLFAQSKGEPSQTYVSWSGSMSFHAERARADFQNDVLLIHRSAAEMMFANELLGEYKFRVKESVAGRQSRLEAGSLMVEFSRGDAAKADSSFGIGRMSAQELRQLEAAGGIVLVDNDFTVEAHRIVKYEDSDLLRIFGSAGAEAQIYSADRDGPKFHGPEFNYSLSTGAIDAPNIRVRGRR